MRGGSWFTRRMGFIAALIFVRWFSRNRVSNGISFGVLCLLGLLSVFGIIIYALAK